MKKILLIITAIVLPFVTTADESKKKKAKTKANQKSTFLISGMKCGGCAVGLKFELDDRQGIIKSKIDFDTKLAMIAYDTNGISLRDLTEFFKKEGYGAKLQPKRAPEPKGK